VRHVDDGGVLDQLLHPGQLVVHAQQQDVVLAELAGDVLEVESQRTGVRGLVPERVVAPGRRVEDRGPAVLDPEVTAYAGAGAPGLRADEDVVAGVAGLQDLPVPAERLTQGGRAVRVRGQQDVPPVDVQRQVLQQSGRPAQRIGVDALERCAVPGLQLGGARLLVPGHRQAVVGHHDVGGPERGVRLRCAVEHRRHTRWEVGLVDGVHSQVCVASGPPRATRAS
jgi:hypothetical protein